MTTPTPDDTPQRYEYKPLPALEKWAKQASEAIRSRFYTSLGINGAMLWQWYSGRRALSADKAGQVEAVMLEIARSESSAPRPLRRGELCAACSKCDYYRDAQVDFDDLK